MRVLVKNLRMGYVERVTKGESSIVLRAWCGVYVVQGFVRGQWRNGSFRTVKLARQQRAEWMRAA